MERILRGEDSLALFQELQNTDPTLAQETVLFRGGGGGGAALCVTIAASCFYNECQPV